MSDDAKKATLRKIIEDVKNDPSLKTTLDISELLKVVEETEMKHLEKRTLKSITKEIVDVLKELPLLNETASLFCNKLIGYRYVDEIYQLHKGKHVRWIRTENTEKPPLLTNGGIVVDIKFTDTGTHIVCKNQARFIQYKFDDCLTFQKLSQDEQLLMGCCEILSS